MLIGLRAIRACSMLARPFLTSSPTSIFNSIKCNSPNSSINKIKKSYLMPL